MFRLHAAAAQPGRRASDPIVQLGIGPLAVHAGQGEAATVAARDVSVEQVNASVEKFGHGAPSPTWWRCGRPSAPATATRASTGAGTVGALARLVIGAPPSARSRLRPDSTSA